ncbi:porin family protein [Massilia suwonensis]|uniref:Porin family protein n=1 Tax=Massilia suwonensis TaxID=648895 RepID=A0ABW0MNQ1_9BURK
MFKKIAAAAFAIAASSAAFAAEPPSFYAGVDISSTDFDDFDRDTGFGAFVGYKYNENISLEAGFHRLADNRYTAGTLSADVTVDQYDLSVLGTLPLSNGFDVYGRLGYNRLTVDVDAPGFFGKEHQSKLVYGIGLAYAFTPVVAGRVEVQKPNSDVTKLAAGVVFKF